MEIYAKSVTVDPEVRAHVYSLASAVGGSSNINDGNYVLGDDALAVLKDLSRWIRLYDDKVDRHDVKRCIAESNLVKGDLLEILAQWPETGQVSMFRTKVSIQCLDLLNTLTWPMELKEETATINHHRHLPFLQLAHVAYKRAILQHETAPILKTVIKVALPSIAKAQKEREKRDEQVINVLLYFLRNVAIISQPQNLPTQGDENDVSRSATINAFHDQDALQLILTICSSIREDFPNQDVVILEILFQLLKGIDPKDIFKEEQQLDHDQMAVFKALVDQEKSSLKQSQRNAPSRHNRFGTMIWVKRPGEKLSTVSGQNVIFDEQKVFEKMDKNKVFKKPRGRVRKEVPNENNDFAHVVHVDEHTRLQLRSFVKDFLDSSFNPLFNSLRRSISSEDQRVQPVHSRMYYYLTAWFLEAERSRQEKLQKQQTQASEDSPFAYVAAVMTQETFVLLNRKIQQSLDDKEWSDVHACMRAFTQILLTVQAMSVSTGEEDQEIAENIQARIFYEETTHDLIIRILRDYKDQGFGYLDSCTELAHVFTNLLERYSKQNVDLQIRSKRRARRKRKEKAQSRGEDDEGNNSEAEDEVEAHRASTERKFDFTRYAVKLMTEPCINTFVRFTHYYSDMTTDQLKRAHRFFYRCAFKMERAIFLMRVDILNLFHRMIKGSDGLPKENEFYRDWEELVKQLFRRCLKKLEERPEMLVEMLFMKMPQTIFYLEHGYDMEPKVTRPRAPAELMVKPGMTKEQEIGVAVSVLINQGKLDALGWVKNVLESGVEERRAWEDEQAARDGLDEPAPNEEAESNPQDHPEQRPSEQENPTEMTDPPQTVESHDQPRPPSISVRPDNDDRKTQLFKDKFLRLLLTLISFDRIGAAEDPDGSWTIPSTISATELQTSLDTIKKLEFDPPTFEDGVTPESLLRNKNALGLHRRIERTMSARNSAANSRANSDDEGVSDPDALDELDRELDERYAPGGPTAMEPNERAKKPTRRRLKRSKEDVDEETANLKKAEKRRREREKDAKIKSTLRITNSDDEDDEEKDAEFFRLEEERRGKMRGVIRNVLLREMAAADEEEDANEASKKSRAKRRKSDVKGSKRGAKKLKTVLESDADEDEDVDMATDIDAHLDSDAEPIAISDDEASSDLDSDVEDDDDTAMRDSTQHVNNSDVGGSTPLSSQPSDAAAPALREKSVNEVQAVGGVAASDDEDDIIKAPVRRINKARMPFLMDSDSE